MIDLFERYTRNRRVLILGFGREGKSTCRFIEQHFSKLPFAIADKNSMALAGFNFSGTTPQLISGESYLEAISNYDVIIKSPGIRLGDSISLLNNRILLSQTGLFLEKYGHQTIGITGTKGKSTTSSLIHHILNKSGRKSFLVGNIGVPPFEIIDAIDSETHVVFELSANQLQFVNHSPHISVLLNLFEEHLDFFGSTHDYFHAKWNVTAYQSSDDFFICNLANDKIAQLHDNKRTKAGLLAIVPENAARGSGSFEKATGDENFETSWNGHLQGEHNLMNIAAATQACKLAGIDDAKIAVAIATFKPLEHRLEYVGNFCGVDFFNDSISTIPQSTIEALKTVRNTHTLILGGFDRGLDYSGLYEFLKFSEVERIIFTGPAGKRMMGDFASIKRIDQELIYVESFSAMHHHLSNTKPGRSCLLSPAASSYNEFRDFAERGRAFKKIAENLKDFCH